MFDAISIVRILHTHAHPDIVVPGQFPYDFDKSFRPLRQNLERVPIGLSHYIEDTAYEIQGHVRMKKITHRIDKDLPRLIPSQRLVKHIGLESDSEIVPVPRLPHSM
jgi:hypothetical protein